MRTDSRIAIHRRLAKAHNALATAVENGTQRFVEVHSSRGWITPVDLANALGITTQAANNRLTYLCALSICERRYVSLPAGGRLFEYRWIYDWNGTPCA